MKRESSALRSFSFPLHKIVGTEKRGFPCLTSARFKRLQYALARALLGPAERIRKPYVAVVFPNALS